MNVAMGLELDASLLSPALYSRIIGENVHATGTIGVYKLKFTKGVFNPTQGGGFS